MPSIKTKKINEKVSEAAAQAKENPYVHKIIEDKELRENAVAALQSIKSAFEEAKGVDSAADLATDKKVKKQVKKAAGQVKATADDLASAGKPKKKKHPVRKLLFVATIGAVIAVVVSEDVRKAVLDGLFGAEEEFEYTSNAPSSAGSTNGAS